MINVIQTVNIRSYKTTYSCFAEFDVLIAATVTSTIFCKRYRLHPVVCVVSYGYSRQHNTAGISSMKMKTDVGKQSGNIFTEDANRCW
jgi:hypothetical protein